MGGVYGVGKSEYLPAMTEDQEIRLEALDRALRYHEQHTSEEAITTTAAKFASFIRQGSGSEDPTQEG